jgi:hypothetical protein
MQQWKNVLERENHRREAKYRDSDGLYPLHWACSGAPPVEVVQILLDAYPSAAKRKDQEGSLPLHFAAHYGASTAVMEALLKVYPKAIAVQDKYGRTPLYHAVSKSASCEVFKLLAKADPSAVLRPCLPAQARELPLSRAVAVRTPLYVAWGKVVVDRESKDKMKGKNAEKAKHLLEVAFLHTVRREQPSQRDVCLLHAVVALDLYLPEQVLQLAIDARPDEASRPDAVTGQLPLAMVASMKHESPDRAKEMVSQLLAAYPQAALVADRRGSIPLTLAAAAGLQWDGGLRVLLDVAPDAITWRDGATGLPPALLAATARRGAIPSDTAGSRPAYGDPSYQDPYHLLSSKYRDLMSAKRRASSASDEHAAGGRDPAVEQLNTIYQLLASHPSALVS